MWKIYLTVSSLLALMQAADYTMAASSSSSSDGSYYYPAPPKSLQLQEPAAVQQSVYAAHPSPANQNQGYYYLPASVQQSAALTQQFASPALDNTAFSLALKSQGHTLSNTPGFNAALTASARSSKTTIRRPASASSPTASSPTPVIGSRNIKLPLPFGVTPLNIAPLPLQAGTSYSSIPRAVTSYGTTYPQRKRR